MSDVSTPIASPGGSGWVINPAFVPPGAQNAGGGTWGSITGTLATQTDLSTALSAKADDAATTTALAGKVPTTRTVAGQPLSANVTLAKTDVGLGNVDNTSDASKPVSTATSAALGLKVSTSAIVDDLTTGGSTVPLSAAQGVALKALADQVKLRTGSGAPAAGLGTNGDAYMRTDPPFLGALYLKAAGAWALADNSYTLGTLPTAAVGNLGCVARVVDTTYCPTGKDFICVTYDGGTSYYWRPANGRWMVLQKVDADTADAGTNADVTITGFNFSLPNRADMIPPGMAIHINFNGVFTGVNGAKSIQVKALAMSGGLNSTLCGMGASGSTTLAAHVENIVYVTSSNTGYGYPFSGWTGNTSTATQTTYAGANWANLAITFTKNGVSASDTVKGNARTIEFLYPA